ncbi:hypothetical protein E4U61_006248 [Claviceps capensis]|nr:hypothetical protein E4U61_006248 [Claviceps capensis]
MPPLLRPGPFPVTRTPGPRSGIHILAGAGGTEGRIFGEPTTLEKPASRVASQQLLKEPTAPKDVSSKKSTTPEELTTSRIPGCNVSRSKGMRLVE